MFKFKIIPVSESRFDKKLFTYQRTGELFQIAWFPEEKAYKIRELHKDINLPSYYSYKEIVTNTSPNQQGYIPWKINELYL